MDREKYLKYRREYYRTHKDEHRRYYQTHKDERCNYLKKYRQVHKDRIKQGNQGYYLTHRDELKKRVQEYYLAHINKRRQYAREYRRAHPDKERQYTAKKRDKGFVPLMDNPFPSSISIDWHHLHPNQPYVVPIPQDIHRSVKGKKHFIYNLTIFLWIMDRIGRIEGLLCIL